MWTERFTMRRNAFTCGSVQVSQGITRIYYDPLRDWNLNFCACPKS